MQIVSWIEEETKNDEKYRVICLNQQRWWQPPSILKTISKQTSLWLLRRSVVSSIWEKKTKKNLHTCWTKANSQLMEVEKRQFLLQNKKKKASLSRTNALIQQIHWLFNKWHVLHRMMVPNTKVNKKRCKKLQEPTVRRSVRCNILVK